MNKKKVIRSIVVDMLHESHTAMIDKLDKVLNSGCIDVDGWDPEHAKMILPKTIVTALLKDESTQRDGKGTSFEKKMAKDVKNILLFI